MDSYQVTADAFNLLAKAYQDRFMDVELYNQTYDTFCNLLSKPNARIMEIGCGPGNITRYLLSQRPAFEILGIDVAPAMIELAKVNNPAATFQVMDARRIGDINLTFDAIMCGFCMPYLSQEDCFQLIKDSATLLSEGGIFYASTIEGDYQNSGYEASSNGQAKAFVYYHSAEYLLASLEENGFDLVDLQRIPFPMPQGKTATHLVFIGRKRQR